ncbi:MAG: glycosyltransferase [Bacteroidales bacterium]|nr:glycosyltransferase [Bacteroidales bacterium]
MKKIVCFGPGPHFKGGIANYNTSLAKAFDKIDETEVSIVSWTQQYPAIIPRDFLDRKSKEDQLEGTGIKVHYITNYNNPATWNATAKLIQSLEPDIVVFQWAIAVQGIPLGFIARKLSKNKRIKVVFDLHFVIQKEGSALDNRFTKFGIKWACAYVVHARQTAEQLQILFPDQRFTITKHIDNLNVNDGTPVIQLYHPVYDMFKPDPLFDKEKMKKDLGLKKHVFLFFGFIRKYKGLHQAIEAFAQLNKERDDVSLLVVGESFWQTLDEKKISTRIKNKLFGLAKTIFLKKQDDERNYRPLDLIDQLKLKDSVVVVNEFVPNEDVHTYFQVSDNLILFYLTATPSGVESIGYNFSMPMLATKVGHFTDTVKDGFNGYLAEDQDVQSMKQVMEKAIESPINRVSVAETTREMSWANYAKSIMGLLK